MLGQRVAMLKSMIQDEASCDLCNFYWQRFSWKKQRKFWVNKLQWCNVLMGEICSILFL